jgi:hypothetical protein
MILYICHSASVLKRLRDYVGNNMISSKGTIRDSDPNQIKNSHKLQFINISGPTITEPHKKRLVRTHAANRARADQERQLRESGITSQDSNVVVMCICRSQNLAVVCGICGHPPKGITLVPSPVSVLGAGRQDPFDSISLPGTEFESFLVDHCT